MLVASVWFCGGLFTDGWAHRHVPGLETFFTPWHAVLYSGFLVSAAVVAFATFRNTAHGIPWRYAVPRGYVATAAGVIFFGVGGFLDMLWHIAFGIEKDVAVLLSPTHLLLATGITLVVGGPFRRALAHGRVTGPGLVSGAMVLGIWLFFTQWTYALHATRVEAPYTAYGGALAGTALDRITNNIYESSIDNALVRVSIIVGLVLYIVRNARTRMGDLTTIVGGGWALLSLVVIGLHPRALMIAVIPAAAAGLTADMLLKRGIHPRFTAPATAAVFTALGLAISYVIGGTWWIIHVVFGVVFLSAVVGLLLSYLAFPQRDELGTGDWNWRRRGSNP